MNDFLYLYAAYGFVRYIASQPSRIKVVVASSIFGQLFCELSLRAKDSDIACADTFNISKV